MKLFDITAGILIMWLIVQYKFHPIGLPRIENPVIVNAIVLLILVPILVKLVVKYVKS